MTPGLAGKRGVAILGSTGSVGTTALRVLQRHQDRFRVVALTAFFDLGSCSASEEGLRAAMKERTANQSR